MSSDVVIDVHDVSKCFHIYDRPQDRLKQSLVPPLQRALKLPVQQYYREFWASRNISFTVAKGETVGIIGRNGSGKSTLLQMICGTLTPTSGDIQTHGRIAALLELGSGFNPEFSGRDNVYMNAALLGLNRAEIDHRFDDIARFADIGRFIDEPVKTYSSGMMVRLAFAVQSQVDPDILVVDEALAVGDARFQAKCFDRLRKLKEGGTSILLVTHSSEQIVTHCDKALLLESGHVRSWDSPRTVVNQYLDLLFSKEPNDGDYAPSVSSVIDSIDESVGIGGLVSDGIDRYSSRPNYNPNEYRWGDSAARITDFELKTASRTYPTHIESGDHLTLSIALFFEQEIPHPVIGFTIKNTEGVTLFGCNTESLDVSGLVGMGKAKQSFKVELDLTNRLGAGDYFISVGVASRHGDDILPHDRRYDSIHVQVLGSQRFHGLIDLDAKIRLIPSVPHHD